MLTSAVFLACLLSLTTADLSTDSKYQQEERHKVVIVGAGVAGFAAATTLLSNNLTDLVVLEASDRVGGRIHTVEFGGVLVDKGAEFVHGEEDNIVFQMVSPLELLASYMPLITAEKHIYADVTGFQYNNTEIYDLLEQARDILYTDYNSSDGSVAGFFYPRVKEVMAANKVDPELGEAIIRLATSKENVYSAADGLEQLGVWGEKAYKENPGDQSWKWKTRGYKTIFEILSKKFTNPSEELPVMEKILFKKEVQKVDRLDGEVMVRCKDGSSYRAEHVVITMSLGVLKKHAADMFDPPLPQNKTDAIQTLGIGCVGKVFILFPTRWWPEDVNVIVPLFTNMQYKNFKENSTHGYWTRDMTGFLPVMQHERMLCAWFSGTSCRIMEQLSENDVTDGLMELLNTLVGKQYNIPKPLGILRTNWASNPYTLGAYSFHTPESDRHNITRRHLSEPLYNGDKPEVLFAGEATHPYNWGTAHGGLSTGRREARNIMKYLRTRAHPD